MANRGKHTQSTSTCHDDLVLERRRFLVYAMTNFVTRGGLAGRETCNMVFERNVVACVKNLSPQPHYNG